MNDGQPTCAQPVSAHLPGLQRLAEFLVRGSDSEDLVQQTAVIALEQSALPRHPGAWLRQVLRNQVRDRSRRVQRRRTREAHADVAGTSEPAPDDVAFQTELREGMMAALHALPQIYCAALEQRFLADRSPSAMAADLGCSPTAARWRVHEGLRRLRSEMDRRFEGREQWHRGLFVMVGGQQATAEVAGASASAGSASSVAADVQSQGASMNTHGSSTLHNTTAATNAQASGSTAPLVWLGVAATVALAAGGTAWVVSSKPPVSGEPPVLAAVAKDEAQSPASPDTRRAADRFAAASLSQPARATSPSSAKDTVRDSEAKPVPDATCEGDCGRQRAEDVCAAERRAAGLTHAGIRHDIRGIAGPEHPEQLEIRVTSGCIDCSKAFDPDACQHEKPQCGPGEEAVEHPEMVACARQAAIGWGAPWSAPTGDGAPRDVATLWQHGLDGRCPPGPTCVPGYLPKPTSQVEHVDDTRVIEALTLPSQGPSNPNQRLFVCTAYTDGPQIEQVYSLTQQVMAARPGVGVSWLNAPMPGIVRTNRGMVAAQNQGKFREMQAFLFDAPLEGNLHDDLMNFAHHAGLDVEKFESDLYSDETSQRVADQGAWCRARGAVRDPSFVIGDRVIEGVPTLATLFDAVDG